MFLNLLNPNRVVSALILVSCNAFGAASDEAMRSGLICGCFFSLCVVRPVTARGAAEPVDGWSRGGFVERYWVIV